MGKKYMIITDGDDGFATYLTKDGNFSDKKKDGLMFDDLPTLYHHLSKQCGYVRDISSPIEVKYITVKQFFGDARAEERNHILFVVIQDIEGHVIGGFSAMEYIAECASYLVVKDKEIYSWQIDDYNTLTLRVYGD